LYQPISSELLAVFATSVDMILSFRPLGFIRGPVFGSGSGSNGSADSHSPLSAGRNAILPLTPQTNINTKKALFTPSPSPAAVSVADAKYGGSAKRRTSTSKLGGIDENTSDEPTTAATGTGTGWPSTSATVTPAPTKTSTVSAPFTRAPINKATSIQFVPQFADGALLVVGWCDGQITSYPLYFTRNQFTQHAAVSAATAAPISTSGSFVRSRGLSKTGVTASGLSGTSGTGASSVASSLLPAWWIPSTAFGYGLGDGSGRSERQSFADTLASIRPTLPNWFNATSSVVLNSSKPKFKKLKVDHKSGAASTPATDVFNDNSASAAPATSDLPPVPPRNE
jgi:hypothetical protein